MIPNSVEKEIQSIVDNFSNDIERVYKEVNILMAKWIADNGTIASSLEFDKAFNDALSRAGYYQIVNDFIDNDYDKMYALVEQGFLVGGTTISYNTKDLENIMALKLMDKNKFTVLANTASNSLKESLVKFAMSDYDKATMIRDMQTEFAGTNLARHSVTIADSSITQFHQSVINIKASEYDDLVWIYRGKAVDSKTRDYCKCIMGGKKYYNVNDKNSMENDSKRRYNCRHHFNAVTVDYAESLGFSESSKATCK